MWSELLLPRALVFQKQNYLLWFLPMRETTIQIFPESVIIVVALVKVSKVLVLDKI